MSGGILQQEGAA